MNDYEKIIGMKGFALTGTLIAVGASAFFGLLTYVITLNTKNETEIKDVKAELSRKGETISALGANVGSLKDDVGVIKSDIKELLQRIPKR